MRRYVQELENEPNVVSQASWVAWNVFSFEFENQTFSVNLFTCTSSGAFLKHLEPITHKTRTANTCRSF